VKLGDVIADRFEISSMAGSGAMGVVYRAMDRASGNPVALKLLRVGSDVERFTREARLLAELDHPGIVQYVSHGETEEGRFLVMEWLEGESLSQRFEQRELTLHESLELIGRIARALGAAHQRQIVHRDLKPSNVYLLEGSLSNIRVLDFGVARQGTSEITETGMIIGSPRYMAPEQARGQKDITPRVDVWAIGALLYRCLTGKTLLAEGPIESVLADLLLGPVPRLSDTRPDLPRELDELVARMLTKDPADRIADGNAVFEALSNIRLPDSAGAPPSRGREPRVLTLTEQRFTCVVVIGGIQSVNHALVRELATRMGANVVDESSGRLFALFARRGTATDLVATAARFALELRATFPSAEIALATGTGPVRDRQHPERTLIARADALLGVSPGIRIDHSSVGLLEGRFDLAIDAVGESARLLGERADTAPLRRLLGRPSPCVGRERELSSLAGVIEECLAGPVARAIILTGPAGVGKSRVRYELMRRVRSIAAETDSVPPEIWLSRADPMSRGSPFGLLAGALRDALGADAATDLPARLRARFDGHASADDVTRIARALGEILGYGADDPTMVDPLRVGDRMRTAFEDFLELEVSAHPLLIVLEDVQWGDWSSLRFLDAALRHLRDRPLCVLAIGRPETSELFPGLWSERKPLQVPLFELGKRASEELARAMLGAHVTDDAILRIVERAAGNAFFLEELIRAVAEDPNTDALPPSVLAMAQARLESLDPEARQLLRAASVLGQVFWQNAVATLVGKQNDPTRVREWLVRLGDRELVSRRRTSRFVDHEEYVFRHSILREAAYSMLTESDRVRGHLLAAGWLEEAGERDALTLAQHHRESGNPERAAPLFLRAAEQSLEGNDFASVLTHVEHAIQLGLSGEALGEAHLLASAAHQWRGEIVPREESVRLALAELRPLSRRWYMAAAEAARIASRLGRHDELEQLVDRVAEDAANETSSARAMVLAQIGVPALRAGKPELAQRIFDLLQEIPVAGTTPEARGWLARLAGYRALVQGDPVTYLEKTRESALLFQQAGDARNALTFQTSVGFAMIGLGRWGDAETVLKDALAGAERMNLELTRAIALHNLGFAVAALGRLEEGIAIEREAVEEAIRQKDRWIECVSQTYLCDLLQRANQNELAEKSAARAEELSDEPNRALVLALRARIALSENRVGDALTLAGDAFALVERLGGIEDGESLVRLVHAEVLHARGQSADAQAAISSARQRLLERAARINDSDLRESFLYAIPENARTLELCDRWSTGVST
jgi:eukaryotic-like serine/threonine-protein kinase